MNDNTNNKLSYRNKIFEIYDKKVLLILIKILIIL